MAKMYTLDNKLLVGVPEIRVGDMIIKVDDREKTVKKFMKLAKETNDGNSDEMYDKLLELALEPKDHKKIQAMNMRWEAYEQLCQIVIAAMTGKDFDPEEKDNKEERFQEHPEQTK